MEAGCAHRVHHPHAAAKCAQCAPVCNPLFVDVTTSKLGAQCIHLGLLGMRVGDGCYLVVLKVDSDANVCC